MKSLLSTFTSSLICLLSLSACQTAPQSFSPPASLQSLAKQAVDPDLSLNQIFPPAVVGYQSAVAYEQVYRSLKPCTGCAPNDQLRVLPIKITGLRAQTLQASIGDQQIEAPAPIFWAALCKWFIQKHATSSQTPQWNVKSWEIMPGVRTLEMPAGTFTVRELRAHLNLNGQDVLAKFFVSAEAGVIIHNMESLYTNAQNEQIRVTSTGFIEAESALK